MRHIDARLAGNATTMRRLTRVGLLALPFIAFCTWLAWPPRSTPISRMMASALPDAAAAERRTEAADAQELSFVRDVAAPDDWVCYFWDYERIPELVRRDTGRTIAANIQRADDQAAWALVIGDKAHVMLIWSNYVRDERRTSPPPTYRKCTRVNETRISRRGSLLVLQDADQR